MGFCYSSEGNKMDLSSKRIHCFHPKEKVI